MKEIYQAVWDTALPYQDKRNDDGHARITLKYAGILVEKEAGDEDIVIPAIMLHDVGWSQLPRDRRMLIFAREATPEQRREVQLEHQREGVRVAADILKKVGYPVSFIPAILEIISQHDTRKGFISKEEGLVRDADKLWRFSREGFGADADRAGGHLRERCDRLELSLSDPDFIYSETARRLAKDELAVRRSEIG